MAQEQNAQTTGSDTANEPEGMENAFGALAKDMGIDELVGQDSQQKEDADKTAANAADTDAEKDETKDADGEQDKDADSTKDEDAEKQDDGDEDLAAQVKDLQSKLTESTAKAALSQAELASARAQQIPQKEAEQKATPQEVMQQELNAAAPFLQVPPEALKLIGSTNPAEVQQGVQIVQQGAMFGALHVVKQMLLPQIQKEMQQQVQTSVSRQRQEMDAQRDMFNAFPDLAQHRDVVAMVADQTAKELGVKTWSADFRNIVGNKTRKMLNLKAPVKKAANKQAKRGSNPNSGEKPPPSVNSPEFVQGIARAGW